jgi:hypothetical protein
MKTGSFRINLVVPQIWRFPNLPSAFVHLLLFSGFSIAMTLEMSLDPTPSRHCF